MDSQLRILAFGAHPDDCDTRMGGMAIKYARLGHKVKLVSLTNGDTGHFSMGGGVLARRRYEEAQCAGRVAGVEYEVVDIHNGQLLPTLENRWLVVRIIREFQPDLILTNRPNDYHPDHRYASQLVSDASYTITIPNIRPSPSPHVQPGGGLLGRQLPTPYPFTPDVAVSIDDVVETKLEMALPHLPDVQWLPYNRGGLDEVPEERKQGLAGKQRLAGWAKENRAVTCKLYGEEAQVKYAGLWVRRIWSARWTRPLPAALPFFD